MNPGKLDKKIEILKRNIEITSAGDEKIETENIRNCFAHVENKITRSITEDNKFISSLEINFTILKCKNFELSTQYHVIKWDNKLFKIIEVLDETPYLKIITKEERQYD